MTNAQASEAPLISGGTLSIATTEVPGRPGAGHGRRVLLLGVVAISVAAVAVGGVQYARVSGQAPVVPKSSKLAEGVAAAEAYQQFGSVYREQVPQGTVAVDQSALVPGGSVYSEQVPSAATDTLPAYGIGGSVYSEQVPSDG